MTTRVGALAAILQGVSLLCLTLLYAVVFPTEGISQPADLTDAAKYLPVVAAHPSWFYVPAWALGLLADALFLVTLVVLHARLHPLSATAMNLALLFGAVGMTLYLMGHVVNVSCVPELIAEFSETRSLSQATATEYSILSRFYGAAMRGGSFFTGVALVIIGGLVLRERVNRRSFGLLAIVAGFSDAAIMITWASPGLPLTGVVLIWLGLLLWSDELRSAAQHVQRVRAQAL
jgi:hypothetical protein